MEIRPGALPYLSQLNAKPLQRGFNRLCTLCIGFCAGALTFELRVWIESVQDAESVRSDLTIAVRAAFAAARIQTPLPPYDLLSANITVRPHLRPAGGQPLLHLNDYFVAA